MMTFARAVRLLVIAGKNDRRDTNIFVCSTAQKYRGYVFASNLGQPNTADLRLGALLVAGRDLVRELNHQPPAQLKPLYARHFATEDNCGLATLVFADGHAKTCAAASILA